MQRLKLYAIILQFSQRPGGGFPKPGHFQHNN